MFVAEDTKIFYRCSQCTYITPWKFILGQHAKSHHSTRKSFSPTNFVEKFRCDLCPFKTRLKLDLLTHKKEYCVLNKTAGCQGRMLVSSATCSHCGFKTASRLVRLVHSKGARTLPHLRCTDAKSKWRDTPKPKYIRFSCPFCSYRGASKYRMKAHYMNKHAPAYIIQWFSCSHCTFKTKRKSNLQRHIRLNHNALEEIMMFQCEQCSYRTNSIEPKEHVKNIQDHMLLHKSCGPLEMKAVPTRPDQQMFLWFKCEHCAFQCKVKSDLKKHFLYKHASDEEIHWAHCQQCPFKSKEMAGLRRHMKTHLPPEEVKWFYCEQCSYKTNSKSNLKRHQTTAKVHQFGHGHKLTC